TCALPIFLSTSSFFSSFGSTFKKIAKDTQPIETTIKKVRSFAPVTNTIFLKVEPNDELNELVDKMYTGKFPTEMEHPFVPHITIAQNLIEDELSDVLGSLKMKTFDFKDTIYRFHLFYQLENGAWTVHESFVFGVENT